MTDHDTERQSRRRTTWPSAVPLQQAADTLRQTPFYATQRLGPLAGPVADMLDEYANALAWLAPYRESEGGYGMWEAASRAADIINGSAPAECLLPHRTVAEEDACDRAHAAAPRRGVPCLNPRPHPPHTWLVDADAIHETPCPGKDH